MAQYTTITNIDRFGPSDYSIRYAVNAFVNAYNDSRNEKLAREESSAKFHMLMTNYDSHESYPDSIVDGWHSVVVTDNLKFCSDAKVRVEGNRIKEFFVDNCMSINFKAAGSIKKAKNIVTLENFNGEQLEIVDAYFVYDIEEPNLVDPPIEPGYISFWTTANGFLNQKIEISNGMVIDGVNVRFVPSKKRKEPACFDEETLTIVLKPGRYNFHALKKGNDEEGVIRGKSPNPGEPII
jgi:hypothetical protein